MGDSGGGFGNGWDGRGRISGAISNGGVGFGSLFWLHFTTIFENS